MRKTKKGRAQQRDRAEYHLLRAAECADEAGLRSAQRAINSFAYTMSGDMEREAERVEKSVVEHAKAAKRYRRKHSRNQTRCELCAPLRCEFAR